MKMLKRHFLTQHGMTPHEYRQRWGLSSDYPVVAPDNAETRRDLAKKIGLGRKQVKSAIVRGTLRNLRLFSVSDLCAPPVLSRESKPDPARSGRPIACERS